MHSCVDGNVSYRSHRVSTCIATLVRTSSSVLTVQLSVYSFRMRDASLNRGLLRLCLQAKVSCDWRYRIIEWTRWHTMCVRIVTVDTTTN